MEILSALGLPAGSKEFASSGLGLHNQAAVVAEAAVVQDGLQQVGKHTPFPTRRTLSDRRPKFALAEAVPAVLVMIHRHAQRVYPLLPLHNHLSLAELGLCCNPWMIECMVLSVEVAACRYHPEPQLRQLLRPATSTYGRGQVLPAVLEIGTVHLKLFLRLRELKTSRTVVVLLLALPSVPGRTTCVKLSLKEDLRGLAKVEECKKVVGAELAVLHPAEVSLKPWCWDCFSGYSSSL